MPTIESMNNLKLKEKDICSLYIDGYSSNKISVILNVSTSSVKKTLHNNLIKIRDSSISHRKYSFDETIFEIIDSHEKAYWIGFLQADCTITNNALVLALASKDYMHIEKFRSFIKSNHPIYKYKQLQGKTSIVQNKTKEYYYNCLRINSKKIVNDLSKYSITTNKTFTTKFGVNIPIEFLNSYMAGLLDADGFITVSNNKITFGFLGNQNIGDGFRRILELNVPELSNTQSINHRNNKNVIVRFSGKQVFSICKFIYGNTQIFMERKRNKVLDFFHKSSF